MTTALRVFVNTLAPPVTLGWMDRTLGPVIRACNFRSEPPPVELRSRMQPAGRITYNDEDGRVVIASRVTLLGQYSMSSIYLHEVAHALCDRLPSKVRGHCPIFCLTMLILYERSKVLTHLVGLPSSVCFYDFADQPEGLSDVACWRAEVVRFLDFNRYKFRDAFAEDLPGLAELAWTEFTEKRQAQAAAFRAEQIRQQALVKKLESSNAELELKLKFEGSRADIWTAAAVGGWILVFLYVLALTPWALS